MEIVTSYTIAFKDGYNAVKRTTVIFNDAIRYITNVTFENWESISSLKGLLSKKQHIERLIHSTKNRKAVYNFDRKFYKFPSYLMRAAIAEALGNVQAYMSNIDSYVKYRQLGEERL